MTSVHDLLFHFLGDHDRAKEHVSEATWYALTGEKGHVTLHDETSIRIIPGEKFVDVFIESPMQADMQVQTPRNATDTPSSTDYYLEFFGYNHKQDPMFPHGTVEVGLAHPTYVTNLGPEWYYISDGIVAQALYAVVPPLPNVWYPLDYIAQFTITSYQEDRSAALNEFGTVGGFASANYQVPVLSAVKISGPHFAAVSPYGVDRSDSANPVYRAAYSFPFDYGAPVMTEDGGVPNSFTLTYVYVYQIISLQAVGKNQSASFASYILDTDIVIVGGVGFNGSTFSSPLPVLFPLGNNRVFALYRKRIASADPDHFFDSQFTLAGKVLSGANTLSLTSAPVTPLMGHFAEGGTWAIESFNQQPSADYFRSQILIESLVVSSRTCVPISQNETLCVCEINLIDGTGLGYNGKQVLLSITPSGISIKSTIVTYWDYYASGVNANNDYETFNPYPPSFIYRYLGLVATSLTTLRAYFYVAKTENDRAGLPYYYIGTYCFTSTDGGTTWDAGVRCTFNFPEDMRNYRAASFHYIGQDKDDNAMIVMPLLELVPDDPNVFRQLPLFDGTSVAHTARKERLMLSTDGVTFEPLPAVTDEISLYKPSGTYYFNEERGMGSFQDFGNYHEGYRPSPYRHLPDYYGTAGPISRDNSDDYGR